MFKCGRDPYPFPRCENDMNFSGIKKKKVSHPSKTNYNSNCWNELNNHQTLQNSRRNAFHSDPLAPKDRLDFVLKSLYDHDKDIFKETAETLVQKETISEHQCRKLKNREKQPEKLPMPMDHPLRIIPPKKMENFNSVKLAIESYHTQITNRGYYRKPDGGFFST